MQAARKLRPESQPVKQAGNFIAAVRYPDGSRDLFHVLKARDLEDAREMVLFEVGDVRSLLITPMH